mgnify:CR=1 FL=1
MAIRSRVALALVLVAVLGRAGTVHAERVSDVRNTKHNLSAGSANSVRATTETQICVFCHTPHGATPGVTPLWNRRLSGSTYTVYTSSSLDANAIQGALDQPGGSSKLCLSCHDGTVAVNSFGGVTGTTMISAANNLGNNLKRSHPIGFTYDTALSTADGSLFDPATKTATIGSGTQTKTGTIASVLLYGGKMECDSCHDVHNTFTVGGAGTGLVKVDPSGSKICLTCHNK